MQLNIFKIVLVTALGMANVVFADYRCCKKQACTECSVIVTSCYSCINHMPYEYCCPAWMLEEQVFIPRGTSSSCDSW